MIFLLLLFLIVSELTAEPNQPPVQPKIDMKKKPVMCELCDTEDFQNSKLPFLKPEDIPCECEILVYCTFTVDGKSNIIRSSEIINQLACLRPVIIDISRSLRYKEWGDILKSGDGNLKDANVIIEYAKRTNIIGFKILDLNPEPLDVTTFIHDMTKLMVPYLKQLKFSDNILIGVSVAAYGLTLKNPCVTDFEALNSVVDFIVVETFALNDCLPEISNEMTPINLMPHGDKYMSSMEEATNFLKDSKCDLEKVYYEVELDISDSIRLYMSYDQVCSGADVYGWCISNTKNFYDKGAYVKKHGGMSIKYLNIDDINNKCECGAFIAVKNCVAGYEGKEQIHCKKIDVHQTPS